MSHPAKTVDEELLAIATRLFDDGRSEQAGGEVTPARMFALGIATGVVLRARAEWLEQRATPVAQPGEAAR